jgi:hypothetical protein
VRDGGKSDESPPTRPWIKVVGTGLIVAVWLPVLTCAGGMVAVSLGEYRARHAAEKALAAVPVGAPLSELLLSTSEAVDEATLLTCYQAVCTDPPDAFIANRTGGPLRVQTGDAGASFETVEAFRQLAEVDGIRCNQVRITYCGRPFMAFRVALDDRQRVTRKGPLE